MKHQSNRTNKVVLTLILGLLAATASAQVVVYDLKTDWSDVLNPNGLWSYREGTNPLPHVANWGNQSPAQPAWAEASASPSNNFLPAWWKATANFGSGWLVGDVVVHTTDQYNGVGNGLANVIWTSNLNGTISLSGSIWEVGFTAPRSNHWALSLNAVDFTSGDINTSNSSRATPFAFASGTGGASALTNIPVSIGDVLRLQFNATTPGGSGTLAGTGDAVGVNLTVTATVPEPSSLVISAVGGCFLLMRRRRER